MFTSVEASLKKLGTTYIDLLYLHWWDWTTPIPEVMQGLNNLVKQGKVLHLGVSDTPAWVISRANEYARNHGLAPFVLYQGRWSASDRDLERDLLPMCISEGMTINVHQQRYGGTDAERRYGDSTLGCHWTRWIPAQRRLWKVERWTKCQTAHRGAAQGE